VKAIAGHAIADDEALIYWIAGPARTSYRDWREAEYQRKKVAEKKRKVA
jgi:hypothetical protein